MKNTKKFLMKVIALILSIVLPINCCAVSFSVLAASTFSVTSASPAIPLFVGKQIDLASLSIEIGSAAKTGNMLTWNRVLGTSAKIENGKLIGLTSGKTKFTVTNGINTQNVWVLVNAEGNNNFSLVDLDFTTDYNKTDWLEGSVTASSAEWSYMTGKFATADVTQYKTANVSGRGTKGALYMPGSTNANTVNAAIYKSEIFEDFYDYSLETDMSLVMNTTAADNMITAPGIFVRAAAAQSGNMILTNQKSLLFRFRNYGGVAINGVDTTDTLLYASPWTTPYLTAGADRTYFTGSLNSSDLWTGGNKNYVFYPDAKGTSALSVKNVKIDLVGKDIRYKLNDNVIFDTIAKNTVKRNSFAIKNESYSGSVTDGSDVPYNTYINVYNQNIKAEKGTVGILNNYGADLYVYSIKVTPSNIENNNLPAMSDISSSEPDPQQTSKPEQPVSGGSSPTRSTVVVGGDSVPSSLRTSFKVPGNLMTTSQYHQKLEALRTSTSGIQDASSQFLKDLDVLDLMLQDSIVYNTDDLVNKSGYTKKYYVSSSTGNDNNSGTSPDKPWKTLKKVNNMRSSMGADTLVSFKRGDTFRGIIEPVSGVDYGAYGVGYKPILMASYSTKENGWTWVETSKPNV